MPTRVRIQLDVDVAFRLKVTTSARNFIEIPDQMDMVVWLDMVKMTFTLDETTVEVLKRISARLQKPQSYVLREAICHYEPHAGQLSKSERKRRVDLFDQLIKTIPERPASEVEKELRQVRSSRRKGWKSRQVRGR